MYSILGRGSFCFNYCLNSAWHGGDPFVALLRWYEAQVSLTVAFSSSAFFGLLFLIFLLTIPHRFSLGFRSVEFAGQSSTPTLWSFNQLLAVWVGAKSIRPRLPNYKINNFCTLLQIPVKGAKGLVITAAVTLTGQSSPCLILSKHLS